MSGYPFYFGVLFPVASIILLNTVVLISMIVALRRSPPVTSTKKEQVGSTFSVTKTVTYRKFDKLERLESLHFQLLFHSRPNWYPLPFLFLLFHVVQNEKETESEPKNAK